MLLAAAGIAAAQTPDVRFRLDLGLSVRWEQGGKTQFHAYDTMGVPSIVALTLLLEPGYRVFVAQRFERISGDGNDEVYIEDPGIWRLGKQYLPMGYGRLLADSVMAVRGDTNLILEGVPMTFAACDGGSGRPRGVVARMGSSSLSASAAIGEHFMESGTALTAFRRPEDASGAGGGYRQVYGVEWNRRLTGFSLGLQMAMLVEGHTADDPDTFVADLQLTKPLGAGFTSFAAYTFVDGSRSDVFRFGGSMALDKNFALEPMLRFDTRGFRDATVTLRARF